MKETILDILPHAAIHEAGAVVKNERSSCSCDFGVKYPSNGLYLNGWKLRTVPVHG